GPRRPYRPSWLHRRSRRYADVRYRHCARPRPYPAPPRWRWRNARCQNRRIRTRSAWESPKYHLADASRPFVRAGQSESCADRTDDPHPTRYGRAASQTHSARPWSIQPCPDWTTSAHRFWIQTAEQTRATDGPAREDRVDQAGASRRESGSALGKRLSY